MVLRLESATACACVFVVEIGPDLVQTLGGGKHAVQELYMESPFRVDGSRRKERARSVSTMQHLQSDGPVNVFMVRDEGRHTALTSPLRPNPAVRLRDKKVLERPFHRSERPAGSEGQFRDATPTNGHGLKARPQGLVGIAPP